MAFIQMVDCRTKHFDELQALEEQYRKATEGKRTVRRALVTRDRDDPEHIVVLVFFDSYESAMVNSNLPETGHFAEKQNALLDGPMAFTNLEVVEDQS